jgi:hypothetical protein
MTAIRKGRTRHYDVTARLRVEVRLNGIVADNPDSVAAALRQSLRMHLGSNWSNSGLRYEHAHTSVQVAPVETKTEEVAE